MQKTKQDEMLSPGKFSLIVAGGVFALNVIDSVIRPPDTVDGVVIPWDAALRSGTAVLVALFGLAGSVLATRSRQPIRLSLSRAITVVAFYGMWAFVPSLMHHRIATVKLESGHLVEAPPFFWLSLLEPVVLPYVLVLIITRLTIPSRTPNH